MMIFPLTFEDGESTTELRAAPCMNNMTLSAKTQEKKIYLCNASPLYNYLSPSSCTDRSHWPFEKRTFENMLIRTCILLPHLYVPPLDLGM